MEPIHNNHRHHAMLPMQVTIHIPVPTSIHNMNHTASGHSGKAPSPNHNQIPTSIHNHQTRPNGRWYCMDENQVRNRVSIHIHSQDNPSIVRKDQDHHKMSDKKYHHQHPVALMLYFLKIVNSINENAMAVICQDLFHFKYIYCFQ